MRCPILVVVELPMLCVCQLLHMRTRVLRLVLIVEHVHEWELHEGDYWVYVPRLDMVRGLLSSPAPIQLLSGNELLIVHQNSNLRLVPILQPMCGG
jgi:hypothetical protein